MKRYVLSIILICSVLTTFAQSPLSFSHLEWNFGTISESDGRVSHIFTGTNNSSKPLVILEIFSSCGCTAPEFSKKPIMPGEKSQIKVTYDPLNRPGAFIKDLTVYDSERRKIATLTISGNVEPRQKSVEELYPVDAGSGVRLSESLCAFSYIYHDRATSSVVSLINTSSKSVRFELRAQEQSGYLTLDYPRELKAGERAEIRVGYNIPAKSARYGTVSDLLKPFVNGRGGAVLLMVHGVAVDNGALSNEIFQPKADIDKYILKFDLLKRTEGVCRLAFTLSNRGDGVLIIRAIEGQGGVGTTLRVGQRIEAGKSITGYATINPSQQEYGAVSEHLTIITNDPQNPMRRLRVTAVIEE